MDDIRPTTEQTKAALRAGWTEEQAARGYAVSDYDCTGILEVVAIDEMGVFESDEAACLQAMRDGIKLIPVSELPKGFDRRYLGWIDTAENRAAIAAYVQECNFYRERCHRKKPHKAGRSR